MSENRVAQYCVGHSANHRGLDGGYQFARLEAKRGKSQDVVVAIFETVANAIAIMQDLALLNELRRTRNNGPTK